VPGLWRRGGGVHLHPLQLHLLLVLHSSEHLMGLGHEIEFTYLDNNGGF
jgi:hypothetical protein